MKYPTSKWFLFVLLTVLAPATVAYSQRGGGGGGGSFGGGGGGGGGGGFGGGGGDRGGGGERGGGGRGGQAGQGGQQGLTPRTSVPLVYPYELAKDGVEGSAQISYFVDANGRATDVKVEKASKPEFGMAGVASLEETQFNSARDEDGKPVRSEQQEITISFTKDMIDSTLLDALAKGDAKPVTVQEVDGGLKPVSLTEPIFPPSLLSKGVKNGRAVIEFIIDEGGKVRVPRIVSATEPEFGWSAAASTLVYQFQPPKKGGKNTLVKVTLPISFEAPAAAGKSAN